VVSLSEPSGSVSSDSLLPFVDSSGSGVGLFRGFGVALCFDFEAEPFLDLALPLVDFGLAVGFGVFSEEIGGQAGDGFAGLGRVLPCTTVADLVGLRLLSDRKHGVG